MSDDIIDRIDSLVDEQLANYANRSGYDRNVNQDRCWHCGGEWHGLAITQKILDMRSRRTFDEDYRYAEDDSPVICPGSEFVGPLPKPPWISSPVGHPAEEYIHGLTGIRIPTFDPLVRAYNNLAAMADAVSTLLTPFGANGQLDTDALAAAGFLPVGFINGDDQ